MCPSWSWTTAFNRGRHWSTALLMSCWSRLVQQVHTLSVRSSKPTTCRTELRDIPVNFSISMGFLLDPGLSSWLHISSATRSIFYSVLTVLGHPLPAFREMEFVVSILHRRSLTELTAQFLLENSLQICFAPHPFFLTKEFNRQFIFIHERHVYQQNVT